jgi:hypothetical protein
MERGGMGKKIFLAVFLLVFISQMCFAKNEIGVKTFIPGMVQLGNGETIKGWSIIGGEAVTLIGGVVGWYLSESEYDKYKSLPKTATQDEFDKHLNNSEFYGTVAVGSFIGFGAIYLYSVIDAIWLSRKSESERQGLYLEPKKDGVALYAVIKF